MLANHPNVLSGGGVATNIIGGTGLFADGTVAAPSISFLADQDTGIYRIGANNLGIAANGAKVLDVSTTGLSVDGVLSLVKNAGYASTIEGAQIADSVGNSFLFKNSGATTLLTLAYNATATFAGAVVAPSLTSPASTALALAAGSGNQNITLTPSGTGVVSIIPIVSVGYGCGLEIYSTVVTSYKIAELKRNSGLGGGEVNLYNDSNQLKARFGVVGDNYTATTLLLGTTTNSANGILQLAASTASSGGIGFGTDTSLYRYNVGQLSLEAPTTFAPQLHFSVSGASKARLYHNGGVDTTLETLTALPLKFGVNSVLALTLDTSQNATFAGFIRPVNVATASAPAYAKGVIYFDTTLNKLRVGGATAFETITSV